MPQTPSITPQTWHGNDEDIMEEFTLLKEIVEAT
jgi:hypothetical protein